MATSPKAAKPGSKPGPSSDNVTALPTAGSRKKLFIIAGAVLLLVAHSRRPAHKPQHRHHALPLRQYSWRWKPSR